MYKEPRAGSDLGRLAGPSAALASGVSAEYNHSIPPALSNTLDH
jgi:hypothetical protein